MRTIRVTQTVPQILLINFVKLTLMKCMCFIERLFASCKRVNKKLFKQPFKNHNP